jgi:hypothetical protein
MRLIAPQGPLLPSLARRAANGSAAQKNRRFTVGGVV